jgi:hypothetical protein
MASGAPWLRAVERDPHRVAGNAVGRASPDRGRAIARVLGHGALGTGRSRRALGIVAVVATVVVTLIGGFFAWVAGPSLTLVGAALRG